MKLLDILGKVGGAVVKAVVPGGGLIVDVVNEFLPDDKKLDSGATGSDIANAVDSLPAEQRAQLLGREFDVDITQIQESNSTLRTMLDADAKTPHTTRPYIAKGAFHVVSFVTIVVISLWAYGVTVKDEALITAIMDGWQFVLAVIGPLVTLLWAYFGILKQEQRNKLNAASGSTTGGLSGIISTLVNRR